MKMLLGFFLVVNFALTSISFAASPETADLEKQLQKKEDQIERLEQEVEYLRNQLMDCQYNAPESTGNSQSMQGNIADPLVGNWECTNNVYNYDIAFYEDGRLIQEEPFFSKVKSGNWSRLDKNRFLIERGGPTFTTEFQSNGDLTITNPVNRSTWECFRK